VQRPRRAIREPKVPETPGPWWGSNRRAAAKPGIALRRPAQASRCGQFPISNPPSAMKKTMRPSSRYPRSCRRRRGGRAGPATALPLYARLPAASPRHRAQSAGRALSVRRRNRQRVKTPSGGARYRTLRNLRLPSLKVHVAARADPRSCDRGPLRRSGKISPWAKLPALQYPVEGGMALERPHAGRKGAVARLV
jgi:hypothetical protein